MSAGPEAVLRFYCSVEILVIREKIFQTHFLSLAKGIIRHYGFAQPKMTILNCFSLMNCHA